VFQKWNLVGATLTYDVNLATAGCGTDASFYLVSMPAQGAANNGDYYCDTNAVEGYSCPEIDLFEANRHALQITLHKCTSPTSGCDTGGCALNTQTAPGLSSTSYGPGSGYTINTENQFQVAMTFETTNGVLSALKTVISQGSNSITLTHSSNCASGYLSSIGSSLSLGMVPVFSYWSGSVTWLDYPACQSESNEESGSQMIISNIVITGAGAVAPPPPPPPPPPPGSQVCGTSTGTNQYYVEFFPPSGAANPSSAPSYVICQNAPKGNYSCTWLASGSKFQCSPGSNQCNSPLPYFNSKPCPFASSGLADTSAQSIGSLDVPEIAGIVGGFVVLVLIVVVVVVVVLKNKKTEEYV
jgi:hypothetical protein